MSQARPISSLRFGDVLIRAIEECCPGSSDLHILSITSNNIIVSTFGTGFLAAQPLCIAAMITSSQNELSVLELEFEHKCIGIHVNAMLIAGVHVAS